MTAQTNVVSMPQSGPAFEDIGVVAFVPEEWGGLWMPRHHVLTRLARYYHIVWAEPAHGWREYWFAGAGGQMDANQMDANGSNSSPAGFVCYRPSRWVPQVYRPQVVGRWFAARRVKNAVALLRRRGCKYIVFYLWRPEFAEVLDYVQPDLSLYHIDDEYSFSPIEQPLDEREVQLIKRVDQVFIHSPALMERKGHLNANTLFITNGVDYNGFAASHKEPEDMRNIPRPRLGYIGKIKTQVDFQLLIDLAKRHPKWSFVLVGPKGYLGDDSPLVDQLESLGNAYFLGNKPVEVVCAYPQHMDVCLLPYKMNDYTKYIYPLKLHEYLASGKPVVGTPIRSLLEFSDAIKLACTVDEWSQALSKSLDPGELMIDQVNKRRSIAKQFDWEVLVKDIARSISDHLGLPYKERFPTTEFDLNDGKYCGLV